MSVARYQQQFKEKHQAGEILGAAYTDAAELIAERSLSKPITDIQVLVSYCAGENKVASKHKRQNYDTSV